MMLVMPRTRTPQRLSRRARALAASAAATTLAALIVTQAPADVDRSLVPEATAEQVTPVAASSRVVLRRHKGRIVGDGRTRYVANRTVFRPRRTSVALPPRVRGKAWVVVDLDTGRLLGKHRARARLPQASTIKLLTAVTATRTIRPSTTHRVTRFEAGQTCSCAGLVKGRWYRRNALLKGMLLESANDAAEAVAGSHPRGRRAFYAAMNRTADRLGAGDTVVKNASGLTAAGAHSSARDLVLFLRAALANEPVTRILGLRTARIATVAGKHPVRLWRGTDYVNRYPGSLGKSGWTTPAKNTLVVVTEIDGRRIAVASLGVPSGHSTKGARRLTEWAAANVTGLNAVGRLPAR